MLYIYFVVLLLNIILGLYFFKKLILPYKQLTVLIIITYILEIFSILYNKEISINLLGLTDQTNSPIYHLLQPIQILYIGFIYSLLFKKLKHLSRIYLPITYVLTVITIIISFTIQPLDNFPSFGSMIQSLFFVFSALLLFYRMIHIPCETPILKQAAFWFNSGNLFFYAVTFVIFGFFQDFQSKDISVPEWSYQIIVGANFILYPCYLVSILLNAKENKNARNPY